MDEDAKDVICAFCGKPCETEVKREQKILRCAVEQIKDLKLVKRLLKQENWE